MKKLIKLQNNKITEVFCGTDFEYAISKGFVEKNVEQGYDGGWYLEGTAPKKSLDKAKEEKLEEANKKAMETILSVYPEYKQRNIAIFGTEEEKNNFKNFKFLISNQEDEYKIKINSCEEVDKIENINIEYKTEIKEEI